MQANWKKVKLIMKNDSKRMEIENLLVRSVQLDNYQYRNRYYSILPVN
jgi:hypothetical protein